MSGETCAVDGCDRPVAGRGYCQPHYWRLLHHGDVQADVPIRTRAPAGQRKREPAAPKPKPDTSWMLFANCRGMDPELFFPPRGASLEPIREVCRSCACQKACADYAINNGEVFGVWGGLSERERRRIRKARRLEAAS